MSLLMLVGTGHAHAQVRLDRVQHPPPGQKLVVLSNGVLAPYSGVVQGWLAACR